ncbi:MAG: phosphoribosylformylglycinamidine synthase [Methylophilaceae bacterium]|nr:phosphoribosylformylglycinamidine synthase [Methylophilaceae bacterium]
MQNNNFTWIYGSKVFSEFRKTALIKKLKLINPSINKIESSYLHLIESSEVLKAEDNKRLEKILACSSSFSAFKHKNILYIGPRIGTISPWSSRASDIAKHAGINISRIERCSAISIFSSHKITNDEWREIGECIYDRMTESIFLNKNDILNLFLHQLPQPLVSINFLAEGLASLEKFNLSQGLALSSDELSYLADYYKSEKRDPTDAELMMFAQANSEHCRHKIFNADWIIENKAQKQSLFGMIRNTHEKSPQKTVVAYSDNSSIIEGSSINRFYSNSNGIYGAHQDLTHYIIKVETHNHPTAISPFAGAATGAGGEIRDEGATGRGSKPKAGLCGFSVSNLQIPNFIQSWEKKLIGKPDRIASPLQIMIEGPIGAASYNNEFGRPNILGYFRTLEITLDNNETKGYHKPIMLAGGIGNINGSHTHKKDLAENNLLIQLGGPAMLIGLGGSAASSMGTGSNNENLDFASVQRGNPEIQRRAQEVIDRCWQMGDDNPILSIHDVGAGGLSNAFPELIDDGGVGAIFDIRAINNEEPGMTPKEIWCNESQERYVLSISEKDLTLFTSICERERCPFAVVGKATKIKKLIVNDSHLNKDVVNMNLNVLLGKPPRLTKNIIAKKITQHKNTLINKSLKNNIESILKYPAVASKNFLITIGDRSVTGLIARDQMVGPWQVPLSNVAVTKSDFEGISGESFSIGEKAPLALINPAASARMAVGESLMNIVASAINSMSSIKLSANWMAASGNDENDFSLFEAVKAIGIDLCPDLNISIPVGKDSMSMQTQWNDGAEKNVSSPLSVVISAFSECYDVTKTLTPQITSSPNTSLIFIDLGNGKNRMGGSSMNLINKTVGSDSPDLDQPEQLKAFFDIIQVLIRNNKILAYHDRSDGGLITCLLEMSFAGHTGMDININIDDNDVSNFLFNEELGAVIQVSDKESDFVLQSLQKSIGSVISIIGKPRIDQNIILNNNKNTIFNGVRSHLQQIWSETSFRIQALRDNPKTASEEYENILDDLDPGISPKVNFDIPTININKLKPKIAILREQGINGHNEMAAAFHYAGFETHDVHMSDILSGRLSLNDFKAMVACGGFSFGDVLGAGQGWAESILLNSKARDEFETFFNRQDTLSLGVCNGCQMMSHIKEIIPGAALWPQFIKNESEQFEARFVSVEIKKNNSPFFIGMEGSILPIAVAHGEGRVNFINNDGIESVQANNLVTMNYVNNQHKGTLRYPFNPNGSELGITGLTSTNGRVSIMMPHPERVFKSDQNSWYPKSWNEYGPWYRMFANANKFFT